MCTADLYLEKWKLKTEADHKTASMAEFLDGEYNTIVLSQV